MARSLTARTWHGLGSEILTCSDIFQHVMSQMQRGTVDAQWRIHGPPEQGGCIECNGVPEGRGPPLPSRVLLEMLRAVSWGKAHCAGRTEEKALPLKFSTCRAVRLLSPWPSGPHSWAGEQATQCCHKAGAFPSLACPCACEHAPC